MIRTAQLIWDREFFVLSQSENFSNERASLVLLFADRVNLNQQLVKDIQIKFPNAKIIFGSTSGHFSNADVFFSKSLITAIEFEKTEIITLELDAKLFMNCSKESDKNIKAFFFKEKLNACLIFSEGNTINGSDLTEIIKKNNPNKIPVFGGLMADMERFEKTYAGVDEISEEPKVVFVGFIGDAIKFNFSSQGGWNLFGPERIITKSEKNILHEINGENALDIYKSYLGSYADSLPGSSLYFPLSVKQPDTKTEFVRTVLQIDEKNKTMIFAGNVPEGSEVRFMKGNNDFLLDAAQIAIDETSNNINSNQLLLLISCVGRKIVLGSRYYEELEMVKDYYQSRNENPTITGFYSYGEIAPNGDISSCDLYNQTFTITSIYEE